VVVNVIKIRDTRKAKRLFREEPNRRLRGVRVTFRWILEKYAVSMGGRWT
jgi:hypothetical protein